MKYSVGQKLWFKPKQHSDCDCHEITIIKVGHKSLEITGFYRSKIRISDLSEKSNSRSDDIYYSGQAYLSKEHYENELKKKDAANILWYEIEKIRNKLSMEQIEKIWDVLKQVDNE